MIKSCGYNEYDNKYKPSQFFKNKIKKIRN